jgi:hypothetical protein
VDACIQTSIPARKTKPVGFLARDGEERKCGSLSGPRAS